MQAFVFIHVLLKVCCAYIFVYPCVDKKGEVEASAVVLHIGNYLMQSWVRCRAIMSQLLMIVLTPC